MNFVRSYNETVIDTGDVLPIVLFSFSKKDAVKDEPVSIAHPMKELTENMETFLAEMYLNFSPKDFFLEEISYASIAINEKGEKNIVFAARDSAGNTIHLFTESDDNNLFISTNLKELKKKWISPLKNKGNAPTRDALLTKIALEWALLNTHGLSTE